MGVVISKIFASLFGKYETRILLLGLDNAGKTTILYKLQMGQVIQTVPTIGFNVETVQYQNLKFQVWDLGGQTTIRPYWRCYYPNTHGIIFVIDSIDLERIPLCKLELHNLLSEEELQGVPLVVMANKQDLPNALSEIELTKQLNLPNQKDREWSIFATSALKGEGLNSALEWLANRISK